MNQTLPEQPTRRADELRPGDRIPPGFLPTGEGAEVKFRWPYARYGQEWVFLLYLGDDGLPDACAFLADKPIPVEVAAVVPDGVDVYVRGSGPNRHTEPEACGWMTPSGPCHLVRDHPLFPFGPREDSGHISERSAAENRARLAAMEADR